MAEPSIWASSIDWAQFTGLKRRYLILGPFGCWRFHPGCQRFFGVKMSSWIVIKRANKGRVNCKKSCRDYVLNVIQLLIITWHGLTFTRLLMFCDLAAVCFLNWWHLCRPCRPNHANKIIAFHRPQVVTKASGSWHYYVLLFTATGHPDLISLENLFALMICIFYKIESIFEWLQIEIKKIFIF